MGMGMWEGMVMGMGEFSLARCCVRLLVGSLRFDGDRGITCNGEHGMACERCEGTSFGHGYGHGRDIYSDC